MQSRIIQNSLLHDRVVFFGRQAAGQRAPNIPCFFAITQLLDLTRSILLTPSRTLFLVPCVLGDTCVVSHISVR